MQFEQDKHCNPKFNNNWKSFKKASYVIMASGYSCPFWHFTWPFEWVSLGEHCLWWFIWLNCMTFHHNQCLFFCTQGEKDLLKVSTSKAIKLKSRLRQAVLTDTFMFYNSETTLSLRVSTLVELALMPSHCNKLTGSWQQECPAESLQWSVNSFTLMPVCFDISRGIVNGCNCFFSHDINFFKQWKKYQAEVIPPLHKSLLLKSKCYLKLLTHTHITWVIFARHWSETACSYRYWTTL